ncbi:hypothetical protein [Streptomyces pilosus]|uniref:Uncharacterized protein n=1 Tax=Streptomyces pilosus TaxID=28893 RepID=A0A918EWV4_9ACTN|nr:hypothetical protein [Streptomyces pilosus]GGQ83437.1 hypothetical protein GCM10010280_33140 [Streptomyces pilosus]
MTVLEDRTAMAESSVCFGFGTEIDLVRTAVGLVLKTDEFPRDRPGARPEGDHATGASAS